MGSSPRQRPGFARDATSTPAFFLPPSPLARDSAAISPSLPFVAPEAPASKHPLPRRARKKVTGARRWADSQAVWLGAYFAFNLSLTLYNKGVLVRFPFPYTLTAVHALFGTIGGLVLRHQNVYTPARLDARSYIVLAAFSVLYAVNIAVSNISLHLVTIPVSLTSRYVYILILIASKVSSSRARRNTYLHHVPFYHPTRKPLQQYKTDHPNTGHARRGIGVRFPIIVPIKLSNIDSVHTATTTPRLRVSSSPSSALFSPLSKQSTPTSSSLPPTNTPFALLHPSPPHLPCTSSSLPALACTPSTSSHACHHSHSYSALYAPTLPASFHKSGRASQAL